MKAYEDRILFLREFTKELISNRDRIIGFNFPAKQITSQPEIFTQPREFFPLQIIPAKVQEMQQGFIKPMTLELNTPEKIMIQQEQIPRIQTEPQAGKIESSLGKIDLFIKAPEIDMIECIGPEKLLLTKSGNKTKVTQISLAESEIRAVLQKFSTATKIPLDKGIFKAQLGNLSVTAVVSDFVGSRFIISKMPIS